VIEAAGGWEALAICERYDGPIHLVLTDMVMPRMSGRELVGHLDGVRPGMKVMYMSGFTEDMAALQGLKDEGTLFMEKPFTPDALRSRVRRLLNESK
jgi:DNA-binding NtrC family response regulator